MAFMSSAMSQETSVARARRACVCPAVRRYGFERDRLDAAETLFDDQLADLTSDGAAELVGRGHNGMQAWRWDAANESWTQLVAGGQLTDDQGFDQEPYYYSIQLVDVDRDGAAELVARAPGGVQTYKWNHSGWAMISASGPFGDDAASLAGKRYKSVRTSVDAAGRAWLYGLIAGTAGADSGAIQVHRWSDDHWQCVRTIPLPGSGWDRESQLATLIALTFRAMPHPSSWYADRAVCTLILLPGVRFRCTHNRLPMRRVGI